MTEEEAKEFHELGNRVSRWQSRFIQAMDVVRKLLDQCPPDVRAEADRLIKIEEEEL